MSFKFLPNESDLLNMFIDICVCIYIYLYLYLHVWHSGLVA